MDGIVRPMSVKIGVSPSVLRLLLSMLLSYPIAYVFRAALLRPSIPRHVRTAYILFTSIGLAYLFCGLDLIHTGLAILGTWTICSIGGDILSIDRGVLTAAVWIFNMTYLLVGYHYRDVLVDPMSWVTPHCVSHGVGRTVVVGASGHVVFLHPAPRIPASSPQERIQTI